MHYETKGEWHRIVRITGPAHNVLELVLRETGQPKNVPITMIDETARPKVTPALKSNQVLREVRSGIRKANRELGTDYGVARIRFVGSDTPTKGVYELLSHALVLRVAHHGSGNLKWAAG